MPIQPTEFIHPADDAARRQMEAIPGFAAAVKAFLRIGVEELFHGLNMASKIRLGPDQLPDLYGRLPPICDKLGITEPEFYLEMNPAPNAYTMGDTRVFVTITSGLTEYMGDDELTAVIAHECGHIACRHVLYHTMASLLARGAGALGILGKLATPVELGLLYWSRRSEFSADRAAAVVMGSAAPVVSTMLRLSGGPKGITDRVNVDRYIAQADAYEKLQQDSRWDTLLQTMATIQLDHPFPAVRAREIRLWAQSEQFARILEAVRMLSQGVSLCPRCRGQVETEWKFCRACGAKLKQS